MIKSSRCIRPPSNGIEEKNFTDDSQGVRAPFLRRDEKLEPIAEKQQTYFVVITNRAESEKAGDFRRQFALGLRSASKISGRTHIHDQHHREFAFFGELFHKRAAQ